MMEKNITIPKEFETIKSFRADELASDAYLLRHIKTGASVLVLANDDDNKVFTIGFRTPVSDDTGVAHITEHSVLCGSRKYPVKDPFMELEKFSLSTFLNAMTYPDKTVYPVASCNDQDFKNLMDVYLDAVFFPNIYNEEGIFLQEGRRIDVDGDFAGLEYNGVVYNEMKGAFSSLDGVLERSIMHSLFPDTAYGFESGGDPEAIPDLKYEQFLEFHRKYYHPSNSRIYLYGNADMSERLEYIDREYLSRFDKRPVDTEISLQKPFSQMRVVRSDYPVTDSEPVEKNTVFAYNAAVGTALDERIYVAFQMLERVLVEMPGAPLKQALLDEGIGADISSIYENGIYQPYFSIITKCADEKCEEKFINTIRETLKRIVDEGIDKKSLLAALNFLEFRYREADYGRYPKGLIIGLKAFDSWLYDENDPFMHIIEGRTFDFLRSKIETDYFEELIEKYLLNNTHASFIILSPKRGLLAKREQRLAEKLETKRKSLTGADKEKLMDEQSKLLKYQDSVDTPQALRTIPVLSVSDISPDPRPINARVIDVCGCEGDEKVRESGKDERICGRADDEKAHGTVKLLHSDIFTNGITYVTIGFNADGLADEDLPYAGLLKSLLGDVDTQDYSYADLNNEIDLNLGSLEFSNDVYDVIPGGCRFLAEVSFRCFTGRTEKAFELVESILCRSRFDDFKRLKEIVSEIRSSLAEGINGRGDMAAALHAASKNSKRSAISERTSGISFYRFIEDLSDNFDDRKEETAEKLLAVMELVFKGGNMIVNHAGDDESLKTTAKLSARLNEKLGVLRGSGDGSSKSLYSGHVNDAPGGAPLSEGFKTSAAIDFVAMSGSFASAGFKYTGTLRVLKNILSSHYLWNQIRVKGGAYGCGVSFSRAGDVTFTSYRDPHLKRTVDVFRGAPAYIEGFDADEREMTGFILGAAAAADAPLTPADLSDRNFTLFLSGISYEMLRKEREQMLSTTPSDIRNTAEMIRAAVAASVTCAVGNESKLTEDGDLFDRTENLFGAGTQ